MPPLTLLFALALPGAALAQAKTSLEPTAACVEAATTEEARNGCIGRAADVCLAAVEGAVEMDAAICLNAETSWWSDRLDAVVVAMDEQAAEIDKSHAAMIAKGAPKMTDDVASFQTA